MSSLYTFCTIFGGSFVLIQFFLMIFAGMGADTDADYGGGSDLDTGDSGGGESIDHSGDHGHSSAEFLKIFSLRTITAGIAFFGIAGLAAEGGGLRPPFPLIITSFFGFVALFSIYFIFRFIHSLRNNGAIVEGSALGALGTVHVRIPPGRNGSGKVIVSQQDRSMEYEAISDNPELLKAGTPIVVKEVLSSSLVLVEPR